jgi:hypothetical protein
VGALRLLEQDARFGGRHQATALALKQPDTEPRLGLLNGGGHRWLGHAELAGRLGHGAAGHDGEKHFHVTKIHDLPSWSSRQLIDFDYINSKNSNLTYTIL